MTLIKPQGLNRGFMVLYIMDQYTFYSVHVDVTLSTCQGHELLKCEISEYSFRHGVGGSLTVTVA